MQPRELLEVFPARHALRVVASGDQRRPGPELREDLPDLSVPPERKHPLLRSGWAGDIEVEFAQHDENRHAGLMTLIGSRLIGRTAVLTLSAARLEIRFQIEDGSQETEARVRMFANAVKTLLGAEAHSVDAILLRLDSNIMNEIVGEERPNLKAL